VQLLRAMESEQKWHDYGGIYHYCDSTVTTWYDFARMIFEHAVELGLLQTMPVLNAVESDEYPQLAERPRYSVLDTGTVCERFGIIPPDLKWSIKECLKDYQRDTQVR